MYSKNSKRMAKYKFLINESAIKKLENIPKKSLKQISKRILSLADNPRPKESQKLSILERYRIRQGDYRIINSIPDDQTAVHVYKNGSNGNYYGLDFPLQSNIFYYTINTFLWFSGFFSGP